MQIHMKAKGIIFPIKYCRPLQCVHFLTINYISVGQFLYSRLSNIPPCFPTCLFCCHGNFFCHLCCPLFNILLILWTDFQKFPFLFLYPFTYLKNETLESYMYMSTCKHTAVMQRLTLASLSRTYLPADCRKKRGFQFYQVSISMLNKNRKNLLFIVYANISVLDLKMLQQTARCSLQPFDVCHICDT